jgi:hypothetical protein
LFIKQATSTKEAMPSLKSSRKSVEEMLPTFVRSHGVGHSPMAQGDWSRWGETGRLHYLQPIIELAIISARLVLLVVALRAVRRHLVILDLITGKMIVLVLIL